MINKIVTYDYLKDMIDYKINEINTMEVGIITKVDNVSGRYDVLPIFKYKQINNEYEDRAILVRCPMSFIKTNNFYIRAPYVVGDLVYIGCSKESLEYALSSNATIVNMDSRSKLFREIDGVILGGLMREDEVQMSSDNLDDFLIQNRINGDKIVVKLSGGIEATTSSNVVINASSATINANTATISSSTTTIDAQSTTINSPTVSINGNLAVSGSVVGSTLASSKGTGMDSHTHKYESPSGIKDTSVGG